MKTLFQNLLGSSFDILPEPVRRFHAFERELFTGGRSDVMRPTRAIGARLLSFIAGLPAPGRRVETYVRFSSLSCGREYWRRDFAGRRYQSVMAASRDGGLIEHFGPFDLYFDLAASPEGLRWSLADWRLLKIPLPRFTKPTIECMEAADGDRFTFDIDVVFPIIGRVVHYSGALRETPEAAPVMAFDGFCSLCDGTVRYVIANEITPSTRFIATQSEQGRALLRANGVDPDDPETFLFIENGRVAKKSEALFALARQMRGLPRLAILARLLPRAVRDFVYCILARNRYRWFGHMDACLTPEPAQRHRFVLPSIEEGAS